MHSHPARVACWKSAVALSTCCLICRATVLCHEPMSPATIPRTPPGGFWKAVNLPIRMTLNTSWGM